MTDSAHQQAAVRPDSEAIAPTTFFDFAIRSDGVLPSMDGLACRLSQGHDRHVFFAGQVDCCDAMGAEEDAVVTVVGSGRIATRRRGPTRPVTRSGRDPPA